MPGYPFTIRQLEVFEKLCNTKSFRIASEELGISQAAVSNQIKALEDQMGVVLLSRGAGRGARLTADGAAFLADLGTFWDTARTLAAHRRSDAPQQTEPARPLRVVVANYLLSDCIRPKLSRFLEEHPEIQLEFTTPTIDELPQVLIERDAYDLGIFQDQLASKLQAGMHVIGTVRCGVFGHRNFLEGRNSLLSAEETNRLPFVLPPIRSPYEQVILAMLAKGGIKPATITGRTQYFDVISSILDRGGSVGVMIEPLLRKEHHNIALLYPLEDWRVIFYRNPIARKHDPQLQTAEDFLISAVLDDPAYPRISPQPGSRLED